MYIYTSGDPTVCLSGQVDLLNSYLTGLGCVGMDPISITDLMLPSSFNVTHTFDDQSKKTFVGMSKAYHTDLDYMVRYNLGVSNIMFEDQTERLAIISTPLIFEVMDVSDISDTMPKIGYTYEEAYNLIATAYVKFSLVSSMRLNTIRNYQLEMESKAVDSFTMPYLGVYDVTGYVLKYYLHTGKRLPLVYTAEILMGG